MPHEILGTYRLQLHAGFDFHDAAGIADYLAALGVSHVYCSPYLQAAPGSTHGYDVIDPTRVNDELGGEEGHRRMCEAFTRHGLGQTLDIVPNHMAIDPGNPWWWDLLENGPSSAYANHFDVAWSFPITRPSDRLLVPILGERYGRAVASGEIRLERAGADFFVRYKDHHFPLRPLSVADLLRRAAAAAGASELETLAEVIDGPLSSPSGEEETSGRRRERERFRERLGRVVAGNAEIAAALDGEIGRLNGDPDALDEVLESQFYRLAFWRTARSELDYRRFFDIDTLIALRMEREEVFRDVHARVLDWLSRGVLDGVRIDHPDGLRDPEQYLRRLRAASPDCWITVEKILEPGERLPDTWPVAGTTGYDFLNRLNGIFVDPAGERPLTDLYVELTGETSDYEALKREKKRLVLGRGLAADVKRLAERFTEIAQRHRRSRDFTHDELEQVLLETAACFPVYRSYVRAEAGAASRQDARYVNEAIEEAKQERPDLDPDVFDFLKDLLLLEVRGELETELVMRFQQLTGPAMAKGAEDTAFYCFHRLVSLNEVGGDPGRFGLSVDDFHRACVEAQEKWPLSMLSTSTHDTKRSEDVRSRLDLLSEIPGRWAEAVRGWIRHNERHRRSGWPDRNAEYLLYQSLVGAWPIGADRAVAYMEKAIREAKMHTSWTRQNRDYEEAVLDFVRSALADSEFTESLAAFVEPLVEPARVTSLALTVVKLTAPGVPDVYRGTELWDLSLVDPDNRRPVDYDARRRLLSELSSLSPEEIWARADAGAPKLWVIRQALHLRRRRPELFGAASSYEPLRTEGAKAKHAVAFSRAGRAVTVAPRLVLGLGGEWADTSLALPAGRFRNELTGDFHSGESVRLAEILGRFPVALLSREEER